MINGIGAAFKFRVQKYWILITAGIYKC